MKDKHLYVAGSAFKSTASNVHHLGFVKEPHELYAAVDCTLHPSIYEPFGQIVSESLACGTFVMVSDHVGAKEIVSKNIGKVIESRNKQAWFDQLVGFEKMPLNEDEIKALAFSISIEEHMKILLK
jgi:glycosyltransferase involved in cell wall biosynthesis